MAFPTPIQSVQVKDNNTFALVANPNINSYVLAATTAKTISFPVDASGLKPRYMFISKTSGDFFARYDGNPATIPGADTADGAGSEINPNVRFIDKLGSFSVIAPATITLSISYYY